MAIRREQKSEELAGGNACIEAQAGDAIDIHDICNDVLPRIAEGLTA
jgi:hypothetical protein